MELYIGHIYYSSKSLVCSNILISYILFIRTSAYVSKIIVYIDFITKLKIYIFFLFYNHGSLMQKFALIGGKKYRIRWKVFSIIKKFNLKKKKRTITQTSQFSLWGCVTHIDFWLKPRWKKRSSRYKICLNNSAQFCMNIKPLMWLILGSH